MNEEIIAYRIGESLFCVDCHEKAAKTLKAVQNPEDPEIKISSKPIKAGDISIFICGQCRTIKGSDRLTGEKIEIPKRKDLNGLRDMIEDSVSKISFIEDFFTHNIPEDEFFSESGRTGFYRILVDIGDDLKFVVNEISQRQQKGLIIDIEKRG